MGIKTVMITGDNPLTAAAIAAEAVVDDFLAQATPEAKLKMICEYQAKGHLVAMTGEGTNDAPALAQADVGGGHERRHERGQGGRKHGKPGQQLRETDRGR
jgi:K+-transporting ATPase ATPase B chain